MKIIHLLFCCFPLYLHCQTDSLFEAFGGVVYLDSMTVTASRSGFEVNDFIRQVQNDESFYTSFKTIRTLNYSADNQIFIKNKNDDKIASHIFKTKQSANDKCYNNQIIEEAINGKYFKRQREYRYYTSKLFDRVFLTNGIECDTAEEQKNSNPKGIEKQYQELKKLIFSPGQAADVPLIGKKTAIFSEDMRPYYNFSIQSKTYLDQTECYVFTAVVKPDFKADKTVIKHLETWFTKENFDIIARSYHLKYYGAVFDFDVKMNVKSIKIGGLYLPEVINYTGFFDIPLKKPEFGEFEVKIKYDEK